MGLLSTLLVVSSSVSCLSASPNNVQMRSYEQLPPLVQDALTNMSGLIWIILLKESLSILPVAKLAIQSNIVVQRKLL